MRILSGLFLLSLLLLHPDALHAKDHTSSAWSAEVYRYLLLRAGEAMDVKRAIHFTASLPPQKATAVFRVVARPDGKIVSIDVARPSAFPHIDSEMRRAMLSGGRVPPAPAGHSGTGIFKVTVNYHR